MTIVTTVEFYREAIAFKANDLIMVQDAAYASLIFDGEPQSILQVDGAKDVAVELHSLSKSYNMSWRIGFNGQQSIDRESLRRHEGQF